jgi:katanin p60 ATPase-containing subunit A1
MSFDKGQGAKGSSLMSIKTAQRAKEEEEKTKLKRRRGVLVMLLQFCQESGYGRALEALQAESGVSLAKFAAADNMDVMSIFGQYEEFTEYKFGRRPKFFRALDDAEQRSAADISGGVGEQMMTRPRNAGSAPVSGAKAAAQSVRASGTPPDGRGGRAQSKEAGPRGNLPPLGGSPSQAFIAVPPPLPAVGAGGDAPAGLTGTKIKAKAPDDAAGGAAADHFQGRALRPLPQFATAELRDLANTVHRDILEENPAVSFDDIAELHAAKQLLKEAVMMPMKYPQLFAGICRPWKGILLFGPPGTGKTMLARAVASECGSTFFNISTSTMVSKWRGDSEKLVRMLFELAAHYAPSTIFLDELDSVMSARASDGSEHEATRRMKTEFLVQMDGLAKRKNGDIVFVLAASNIPWDLDAAVLRRLEKRIHVGPPTAVARAKMLRQNLPNVSRGVDFEQLAAKTAGYSGADVDILCREATMRTVRTLIAKLEAADGGRGRLDDRAIEPPEVTMDDIVASVAATRPSGTVIPLVKYRDWEQAFGSTLSADSDAEASSARGGGGGSGGDGGAE